MQWGDTERRILPGGGGKQMFGQLGGLIQSLGRKKPDDLTSKFFFLMFYIRIDKNNKHDTLKQISLCCILNTLCRPQYPGLGMPLTSEQGTSYVCMNQFVASMEVYPYTKYSTSKPYSLFRYCAYHFDILWGCLGMPYKYIYCICYIFK